MFDSIFPRRLLYITERLQYDTLMTCQNFPRPSNVYGVEHFIRLFCMFTFRQTLMLADVLDDLFAPDTTHEAEIDVLSDTFNDILSYSIGLPLP